MSDTKWKNLGGKINEKEAFTDKPLSPLQFPPTYPLSEPSDNNDTIKRIKKIKKSRLNNPNKIPILENIYESEDNGSESVFSSPEDIFTHFFESPKTVKEGLTLPSNLKIKPSPGSDPNASGYDKINVAIAKKTELLNSNLTLSQKAYSNKMTETRAQIDKLKHNIFNIDKLSTDFSEDINATPPPDTPGADVMGLRAGQDAEKEATQAIKRIGYVIKLMIQKLLKWTNLGIEKFKLLMFEIVLKYNSVVISISRALTGYYIEPDGSKKYYVTEPEINTFSKEIVRFLTILMSWIFLYNWYYLMFFLKPEQQFKLKLNDWYENHSGIYAAFGPSLRAVENIDWLILEYLPRIRYLIPSNGVLFFLMSIIFIVLVQKGKQWTIMNDFFNAVNKNYTTSIISAFVIGCIVFYGLSLAGYFASMFGFALLRTWYTALLLVIFTVVYLLCIITVGVPLGMMAVCGYFFFYSFFGIVLYNGLDVFPVLKAISQQITNVASMNADISNLNWGKWLYVTLQRFVKYFLYFMFEIFILYILVGGLVNYVKGYNVPLAEKATLKNMFSTTGAFKEAFHHLYTWLIIINVLLIILIFVIMKMRYDSIKHLPLDQPFNYDTGETMFQKLVTTGSTLKNAVVEKYNQASQLKSAIGKARTPVSGKAPGAGGLGGLMGSGMGMGMGSGIPGMGNIMNGVGSLDSNTTNAVMTSAIGAASEVAKNPKLRKAAFSAIKDGNIDTSLLAEVAKENPEVMNRIMKHGETAAGAVANDEGAKQYVADNTGTTVNTVERTAAAANMAAKKALKSKRLEGIVQENIADLFIEDAIRRQQEGRP